MRINRPCGALMLASAISVTTSVNLNAEPIRFARSPHIANDGRLTFTYHGDIWVADADGSNARRLTAHIASDSSPRFSPDGTQIAFTSDRMGNDDVWVMSATGGEPRQLTFNSTGDSVQYWMPDGQSIVFSTSRGSGAWGSPLHTVGLDGKLPMPMAMDRGATGMVSQDGKMIAFNRNSVRSWRKGYRGNADTNVWVMPLPSGPIKQLTDLEMQKFREHTQDANPMWGADGLVYFASERSGTFNIWKIDPDSRDAEPKPVQVTTHTDDGVQNPSMSPDGTKLVYENEFEIWRLDTAGGQPRKIEIGMQFDPKDNYVSWVETTNETDGFTPSPDGEFVALDRHGEIFIAPSDRELGEKTQVTSSAWRDRSQVWSPDGMTIAYISDESLEEEIWLYSVADKTRRKLTTHESTKSDLTWSPDSKRLGFSAANRLFVADAASGEVTDVGYNEDGGYNLSEFSADGRWLVYSRSNADLDSEIYLFDIEARKEYNLTQDPASDRGGVLTPDGKTLVFTSSRDGATSALYAVTLAKMTEDPEDPLVLARKKKENPTSSRGGGSGGGGSGGPGGGGGGRGRRDRDGAPPEGEPPATPPEDEKDPDEGEGDDDKPEEAASKPAETQPAEVKPLNIVIDLENIDRRARRLTSGSDSVSSYFLSKDGKTIYYVSGAGGGFGGGGRGRGAGAPGDTPPTRSLNSISVEGRDQKKIADGSFSGLTPTADKKTVFFREADAIQRMGVSGGKKEPVNFAFTVKVDHRAEWEQIFEEAWRVMKYRFYDEKMHGRDWNAIKAFYKPMLRFVGENQDVYDLCNEMIGELNASHTGVSGPPTRDMPSGYSTRSLGFEMQPGPSGDDRYLISHIYREGPADKEWLNLKVGDAVLEIDGQPIKAGDNYFAILNHLLNDYVNIKIAPQSAEGSTAPAEPRVVRIRTSGSMGNVKYEEWVEASRDFVDRESGGKIGYVHIRSMNQQSLERFQNEINQYWNKQGMVIDIRYNGGGNIDQELIDILERKPYEYWNSRWGGRAAGRRPRQAIAGPQVMLINWRSASDSEVTPQAFRDLKLGRIVGNPTNGSVIATGSYSLINGASIRTPGSLVATYDPKQPNNYGINLENFGVPPDVWVENTPEDELKGFDRELKAAVDEALAMLGEGLWQYAADEKKPATGGGGATASGSGQQQ